MPNTLSRAQVEAVASLASLELTPDEVDLFSQQLGEILEYADRVRQIDTSGVPPTAYVMTERTPAQRPDIVGRSLPVDEALDNAPDADHSRGFFRVPKVIG